MAVYFGFNHLDILSVDLKKWCRKWDIEIFEAPCNDCGIMLKADIPIAGKNRRGLRAEVCRCGNESVPFTYVDVEGGLNDLACRNFHDIAD